MFTARSGGLTQHRPVMRIILIPLVLVVAVVVAMLLLATAPSVGGASRSGAPAELARH